MGKLFQFLSSEHKNTLQVAMYYFLFSTSNSVLVYEDDLCPFNLILATHQVTENSFKISVETMMISKTKQRHIMRVLLAGSEK